ncbi:hypothetical protein O1611_g9603 [Lasiodiplodia mahajangana]|uniref:Uncharacterized protein n=1 Tax=Lasiodiplodia mahajangana TaxID=1108764 RepID=A0ACC2J882_9PEZI|nr:hypothetical protein O1611_g9603 [Lasiodiplodia mahajangana]
MNGHNAAVERLVSKANIDQEDKSGFAPLIFAAINGHPAVVGTLLRHGAKPGNSKFDGNEEDIKSSERVIEWLRSRRRLLKRLTAALGSTKWGRIYSAALDKWTSTIRPVADDNTSIRAETSECGDSLSPSAGEEHPIADDDKTHISSETDSNIESFGNGVALLNWATEDGRLGTGQLLKRINADEAGMFNQRDYWTPMRCAVRGGHGHVVRRPCRRYRGRGRRQDAHRRGSRWRRGQCPSVFPGPCFETLRSSGNELLMEAVQKGYNGIVQTLLEAGANTEHVDPSRAVDTMLYLNLAVKEGREGIARALLRADADPDGCDVYGNTPLIVAAQDGQEGCARALLEGGANIEASDSFGITPLLTTVDEGHVVMIRILLGAGANPDVYRNNNGNTALSLAISRSRFYGQDKLDGIVQMFLEAGANIEAPNLLGETVLTTAAAHGCESVVRALIRAGADKEAKDALGRTVLDWTIQNIFGNDRKGVIEALNKETV